MWAQAAPLMDNLQFHFAAVGLVEGVVSGPAGDSYVWAVLGLVLGDTASFP